MINKLLSMGSKTGKIQVVMAVGAALVAVYEAITTIQQYNEDKELDDD